MCAWTYDLDTATCVGTDPPASLDNQIRLVKQALVERLSIDHYLPLTGTNQTDVAGGQHSKVTLRATTKPTATAGIVIVYGKVDGDGNTELYCVDVVGNEKQIVKAGKLNIALADIAADLITGAKILLLNNTYLTAKDAAGTGTVSLIKANASDKPVLPDASQLATTAAPTLDADIANKKFVDDQIDTRRLGALEATDADGNALVRTTVYQAPVDGEVIWNDNVDSLHRVAGYVGTANPPTITVAFFYNSSVNTRQDSRSFRVAAGEYWKIVAETTVQYIYWRPYGTGSVTK